MRLCLSLLLVSVLTLGLVSVAVLAQQQRAGIARDPITPVIVSYHPLDGIDVTDYGSDVRIIDLDGLKKLLLRDPKDAHPLLVNFWATWCDGCREEFPDLVKIDNDYRAKGLNFLSVTLDEVADKAKAVDFLKEMKATMPVVLLNVNDPEPAIHAVDEKWDGALPATFLYDREGKVVFKYFGKIKPAELRAAIDKAVGSKQ